MKSTLRDLVIDLGFLAILFVFGVILLALGGCGELAAVSDVATTSDLVHQIAGQKRQLEQTRHEAAANADDAQRARADADDAHAAVDKARGLLSEAEAKAKTLDERAKQLELEKELAPVKAFITVCQIACLAAALLGVIAAVVIAYCHVPWGWRIPAGVAGGAVLVFILLCVLRVTLTHLVALAVGAGVVVGVGLLGWWLWSLRDKITSWNVSHELRRVGDEALDQLEARGHGEIAQSIKAGAASRQVAAGIQHLVVRTIAASKRKLAKV